MTAESAPMADYSSAKDDTRAMSDAAKNAKHTMDAMDENMDDVVDEDEADWEDEDEDENEAETADKESHETADCDGFNKDPEDLYAYFGVEKSASTDQVKKAFRKMCLRFHPDKLTNLQTDEERAEATHKFQQLTRLYGILSDPVRRKRYDDTGYIGEGVPLEEGLMCPEGGWDSYFRNLWEGMVTLDSIAKFELSYRGSLEEQTDVLSAYKKSKGSMDRVLQSVPFSTYEDEDRFRQLVQQACSSNDQIPVYSTFFVSDERATKKRKVLAEREARAAEKALKDMKRKGATGKKKGVDENNTSGEILSGEQDDSSLRMAMMQRRAGGDPMEMLIAKLEAQERDKKKNPKKGGKASKTSNKDVDDKIAEPTEEDFVALQAKLFGGLTKVAGKTGKKVTTKKSVKDSDVDELEETDNTTAKLNLARTAEHVTSKRRKL